ncbi:two-component system, NtrC family, nitrogen regulation sensor histidine kinase GlnL [Bathymodiolus platifrons methanotrophic gill symbiont]|uniref:nitrogen regulation protein NR(II) n=1 Tax=Bathymodiolus platifrons methanotrophic gill symbiont TaxID=113268 RepID=UPI000B413D4A|nr:nitrogen regulation protein NR(II) [Bathymodiolus platifrons methanotrophic gill symbiont]MCK5869763.1 nitrogen regulation protein NR(II) [Methyloprofundus sp.]TXK96329.1 two-component system sensor histidine kinase NtrB [Methylococcaceae bacterium CS4]TXK97580.1 two-component system sensor histidine kinase NtrB [Methylococcaceae bacterium CS5]TXL05225.1 two-component system sensor histidine kinase NtrB [Methylococcaceae bacterium CS1]TXL05606.1 two-component system sensor histidine kinase 
MHNKILDNINEAILLFNNDLKLTYINTAGEILFEDSARHLLGKTAKDVFGTNTQIHHDLRPCIECNESFFDRELTLDLFHRKITISFSATPILENQKQPEVLLELQQLDRHLRISKEEQLLAQENISRMLMRGFAHEIKNPLGGLRGAAQLLELELQDNDLKEYTQIIIEEADRMKALMDKMLGPNKPPNKVALNIHEALERVRQLVQAEMSDMIIIKRDYDPSIPELKADKNQLIQAFLNIVRNAAQAIHDTGEIILRTRIYRQMTIAGKHHKLTARIDIIDNGSGIPPELMNQIFYPMITGRSDGTGLGLPIAQSIINQYNGIIECISTTENTTFSIYLPVGNVDD